MQTFEPGPVHNKKQIIKSILLLLGCLVALDVLFSFLHVAKEFTLLLDIQFFSLTEDQSLPEIYQYLKFLSIIILLALLSKKEQETSYFAWVTLFVYLLLDDAIQIHETLGEDLSMTMQFEPYLGLRPQDFGELLTTLIFASVIMVAIAIAYATSSTTFRYFSKNLLFLLSLLVFFGVVVDMLAIMINIGSKVDFLLTMIEDSGEMLVASLMLGYTFAANKIEIKKLPSILNCIIILRPYVFRTGR